MHLVALSREQKNYCSSWWMDLVALSSLQTILLLHFVAFSRVPVKCLQGFRVKGNSLMTLTELLVLLSRKQGYFDLFGFNGGHMKDKHDTDIVQKSSFFMDLLIFL